MHASLPCDCSRPAADRPLSGRHPSRYGCRAPMRVGDISQGCNHSPMPYAVRRGLDGMGVIVAVVALGIPFYLLGRTLHDVRPVRSDAVARSVVWSDRVFLTQPELSRWLHQRGVAYSTWAERHPRAARGMA